MSKNILIEMDDRENSFSFESTIQNSLEQSKIELETIEESINTIKNVKPACDKIDYLLAASSGALCGIIDIFLVGKPKSKESILGKVTDKWAEDRTRDFAKIVGCSDVDDMEMSSVIRRLEKKFKVNYDQRGAGDSGREIFGLTMKNHHFKSLGHNPIIMGAFFSVLDQFTNQSHFVSEGQLISIQDTGEGASLRGSNVISKIFCGLVNWLGHLMSDANGSSGSKGRGMGIPSPLWTWTNEIIAIKAKLKIPVSEFDKNMNDLSIKLFNEGYDIRFQTAQIIPVVINEMIVRFFYSVRRMVSYYANVASEDRSFNLMWSECEPFSNPTVKRMLTTAHGTFCLLDVSDAIVRGGIGAFNVEKFLLRLNIVGVGRFTISLYGEARRGMQNSENIQLNRELIRRKEGVQSYIEGLECLTEIYNDEHLIKLIADFSNSDLYLESFTASIELAENRGVPTKKILYTKKDGDNYFRGGKNG